MSEIEEEKVQKKIQYTKITNEMKKKLINDLLHKQISLKNAAYLNKINENSAKFIWQQYESRNKIVERKIRGHQSHISQNNSNLNQSLPNEIFHEKTININEECQSQKCDLTPTTDQIMNCSQNYQTDSTRTFNNEATAIQVEERYGVEVVEERKQQENLEREEGGECELLAFQQKQLSKDAQHIFVEEFFHSKVFDLQNQNNNHDECNDNNINCVMQKNQEKVQVQRQNQAQILIKEPLSTAASINNKNTLNEGSNNNELIAIYYPEIKLNLQKCKFSLKSEIKFNKSLRFQLLQKQSLYEGEQTDCQK